CFFFQAEDGIRDDLVTGVQTCALPISLALAMRKFFLGFRAMAGAARTVCGRENAGTCCMNSGVKLSLNQRGNQCWLCWQSTGADCRFYAPDFKPTRES